MNRALEAIKDMLFSADANFESLVIVVSASFTFGHFEARHTVAHILANGSCDSHLLATSTQL
jgi:hypothetical protein